MEKSKVFSNNKDNKSGDGLSSIVFGVDFGTTNSVISLSRGSEFPKAIYTMNGDKKEVTTRTMLTFLSKDNYYIGSMAKKLNNNFNSISSFKRSIGSNKIFTATCNNGDIVRFTPKELITLFMKKWFENLYSTYSEYKGQKNVLLSVPAYYSLNQVNQTKEAFIDAGLNPIMVQQEPTSASLVFQEMRKIDKPILVFDLGGGTFDAVLMESSIGISKDTLDLYSRAGIKLPDIKSVLEVIDIIGDNELGGDDIDRLALSYELNRLGLRHISSPLELKCMTAEIEQLKSSNLESVLSTVEIAQGEKIRFESKSVIEATQVILDRCLVLVDTLLNRVGIHDVHCVLCGGATKSTLIRDALIERFDGECSFDIDPDLSVSIGNSAAVRMLRADSEVLIINRTPKHLGILVSDKFKTIIPKGSTMPTSNTIFVKNAVKFAEVLDIKVLQSEEIAKGAQEIFTMVLKEIDYNYVYDVEQRPPNGIVDISVTLSIAEDGTVTVQASQGNGKVINATLNSNIKPIQLDDFFTKRTKLAKRFSKFVEKYSDEDIPKRVFDRIIKFEVDGTKSDAIEIEDLISKYTEKIGKR